MITAEDQVEQLLKYLAPTNQPELIEVIASLIQHNKAALAERFYSIMAQDAEAAAFLAPATVQEHLKPGLERWMEMLFCSTSPENLRASLAIQRHVGEVHARSEIPLSLVARGMRLLKNEISLLLQATTLTRDPLVMAMYRVHCLIDYAFEVMSEAYDQSRVSGIKTDEAFRLFSVGHNLAMEREKQTGAILEWENKLFRSIASEALPESMASISASPFSLWFHHKAPHIFGEALEYALIEAAMLRIDNSLLPQITRNELDNLRSTVVRSLLKRTLEETEQIKYLLNAAFDRLTEMEIGKDALTQLFNRRFLPTILRREIDLARRNHSHLALLMIDVDFFKNVNDLHGHEAGDRVLQQVATLILNNMRAGDFAFRYGGEEFMLVLTEVDAVHALKVAEKIRQRIGTAEVLLSNERTVQVSVSIGIATHDGHPDYIRLIERADKALYAAKNSGRNRCNLDSE